jgi:hypothetical protein
MIHSDKNVASRARRDNDEQGAFEKRADAVLAPVVVREKAVGIRG